MTYHPQLLSSSEYLTGEDREYIINCILPASSMTLVTAPPGVGKSKFAMACCRAVITGKPFFDQYVTQGKAAYFNLDRMFRGDIEARLLELSQSSSLADWVDGITWVEEDVNILAPLLSYDDDGNTSLVKDKKGNEISVIDYLIDALKDYKLIVLDTWHKLCVNAGAEENSADDIDRLMMPVRRLATETGAAVLILHHTSKHDPSHGRGSIAIEGSVDHVLNFDGRADGGIVINITKTRTDKIHIFPITIEDEISINMVQADQIGAPIGAWKSIIDMKVKVMSEDDIAFNTEIKRFKIRMRRSGEQVGPARYGMHRNSLLAGPYAGQKKMLDQIIDHFRKIGSIDITKGKNPFYVLNI